MWRAFFAKFLPWVWVSVVLLVFSGYWILFVTLGGFRGAGMHIHIMHTLGWMMFVLFFWLFHGPWLKFKRAVDAKDFPRRRRSSTASARSSWSTCRSG